MEELIIQTLAGLVVAILSGSAGYLVRKRFPYAYGANHTSHNYTDINSYGHLSGIWHTYCISYNPEDISEPVWLHGKEELQIEKNHIKGTVEYINHPVVSSFHYQVKGEIRAGRMLLTETAIEDTTEFSSNFFPNLLSAKILVGFWSGQDNLLRPIAGPIVLSRSELAQGDLNKVLKNSNLQIIPVGEYKLNYK